MTAIEIAKRRLQQANNLVILTGAGISAESGIPTFRGHEGLWNNYRAEELATPQAFERDPELVWRWYDWRRQLITSKKPNAGHFAIAELEKRSKDFLLITQNVDGLHSQAGFKKKLELHGNIWKTRCTGCGEVRENREVPLPAIPPLCPSCGGLLRPHIVWFGESLDPEDMERSYEALENCDLLLVVGTSGVVHPAASFAALAKRSGAHLIEFNLERTPNSHLFDEVILGKASEVLNQLL